MSRGKPSDHKNDKQLSEQIGAGARRARKRLGITQEDAGELLGISSEFYARIERGHALPSVPTFYKIVTTLQVSAGELLGLTEADSSSTTAKNRLSIPSVGERKPDRPELKRIMKRLQDASRPTLRLVTLLIKELEERFNRAEARNQ